MGLIRSGTFSIFRPVFGPYEATHDANEPTVPANEDLVGTHSFQGVFVCDHVFLLV